MNIFYLIKKTATIFLVISLIISCKRSNEKSHINICNNYGIKCLDENIVVEVMTNKGSFDIELNSDSAPLTAGNFLDLSEKGIYENTIFHRVIKKPTPFVVQGGDPLSKPGKTNSYNIGYGNYVDKNTGLSRFIPLEIKLNNDQDPIYNKRIQKFSDLKRIKLTHSRGSVSMARSESLSSGSSQFFISLRNLPELDGRYSVFGNIIKGMNIVDSIEEGDYIIKIKKK